MSPIEVFMTAVDEIHIAKHSTKPFLGRLIIRWIDYDHTERSVLLLPFPCDYCELHLRHRVEVGHREPNSNSEISLAQRSHSFRPNCAQAWNLVKWFVCPKTGNTDCFPRSRLEITTFNPLFLLVPRLAAP